MSRIMVVDDSNSMRALVAQTLRGAGHDVVEAADGQIALDLEPTAKVDLFLCDVNMPRVDGLTLVKRLRTLGPSKFTPILMLTTESGANKKAEGKTAGATGWLVKPFNPEQLLQVVGKVLP